MPRLSVLVVIPLPGAAPRGEDVKAAPLSSHIVEFLTIMSRDHRVFVLLILRVSLRGLRRLGQLRGGTYFTAGQGVRSDGFADQTRRQTRTLFFVTVHCQGFLLETYAGIRDWIKKIKSLSFYLCYLNESNLSC